MSGKGENTRKVILEKSRILFCKKGYKGVTMQDICQETGLSRGGLYRHFESTEQIFREILENFSRGQNGEIEKKIHAGLPASQILEDLLDRYRREMLDSENSLSLAICEFFSTVGQRTDSMVEEYRASKRGWTALIEYGIRTGEFRSVNSAAVFELLVFAYQGVRMYSRLMEIDPRTPERILGEIRKILLVRYPGNLRLVRPDMSWKEKALAFRQDFFDHGEPVIFGSELLDKTERYEDWLEAVTRNTDPATVNPDWVLTDTFFAVDEEEEIVGIIDLRHSLNGFLADLGNCGYSVRPSRRRMGFGSRMLSLLLDRARALGMESLHISVERDNIPSVKVIRKSGGVYERGFTHEGQPADIYRLKL